MSNLVCCISLVLVMMGCATANPVGRSIASTQAVPTPIEVGISTEELGKLQADVLCIADTGSFDAATREGFYVFKLVFGLNPSNQLESKAELDLLKRYDRGEKCVYSSPEILENREYFSQEQYGSSPIKSLQTDLNTFDSSDKLDITGELDVPTRKKIAKVREALSANPCDHQTSCLKDEYFWEGTKVTDQFYLQLKKALRSLSKK